jgi:phosphatidylinositol-3-phosphatase
MSQLDLPQPQPTISPDHFQAAPGIRLELLPLLMAVFLFTVTAPEGRAQSAPNLPPIKTVFIILEENSNWSGITPALAPYIQKTLVPMGARAEQYYNPPGNHPSEPNYVWLEAGSNLAITNDSDPGVNHQATADHLVSYLNKAGISWKTYQEDIDGTSCPLVGVRNYAPKHNPFVFFNDVTDNDSAASAYCISHVRPYSEFATDLQNNTVARYNFITPNLCHDMHDCGVAAGDTWLSNEVPKILASQAYRDGGALFITWDEGSSGNGPIGMIVLSPFAKTNYSNSIYYTHSSTLKTVEELFGVTPLLRDAANASDLSDLFSLGPPVVSAVVNAASFAAGFAPGSWVTIEGTNLTAGARSWRADEIVGGNLPKSLDAVSVTINGLPAFVSYISPTQINVQAPSDDSIIDGQIVPVTVTSPTGTATATAVVRLIAPALFPIDAQHVAARNLDGSIVAPAGVFPGSHPAKPGDVVEIYLTGLGPTNPPIPAGQLFSAPAPIVNPIRVTVAGKPAPVGFAGLVSPGLDQVNVTVPDVPDGDSQVSLQVGNVPSQNTGLLAVHH